MWPISTRVVVGEFPSGKVATSLTSIGNSSAGFLAKAGPASKRPVEQNNACQIVWFKAQRSTS